MKVKDLLDVDPCDNKEAKTKSVLRKALKKKRTNPQASKTDRLSSFIDVFGGMAGYDNDPDTDIMGGGL